MSASKTRLMVVGVLFVWGGFSQAQRAEPDLSWTFQWGDTRHGLLFDDAGMSPEIKTVIRDDLEQVCRLNPHSNAVFHAYAPDDGRYGECTGLVWIRQPVACPEEVSCWDYRLYGGTNFFIATPELCSKYAGKAALTNRLEDAAATLSNFLHTANLVSVSNTTAAAFADMWWRFKKGRPGMLDDDTAESFADGIRAMGGDRHHQPSLLFFWERPATYWNAPPETSPTFGCTITAIPKTGGGEMEAVEMDAVYKGGKWRFVAWE